MFNSKLCKTLSQNVFYALTISALFSLYSCVPSNTPTRLSSGSAADAPGSTDSPTYQEPQFPFSGTFIQDGSTQTQGNLALPLTFSDSFLIRGKALSQYVRKLPNTTKFCVVGKFNYVNDEDKFLILSGKPKLFTDLINKTTEYYLQVEPSEDTTNQNDCLTYNLTNSLFQNASTPSAAFSLNQLCMNCSSAISSTPLKLFFVNGEEVPTLSLGSNTLSISSETSSGGAGNCVADSGCKALGFSCCLNSQCVKDGVIRPSSDPTDVGFIAAQEDVSANPIRYLLYPQYYYVCESNPGTTTTGSSGGGPTADQAAYEAQLRLMEYTHLYECLNKVDGEFSYCTIKIPDASENIPGNFSAEAYGHNDDVNFTNLNPNLTGDLANNIVKIYYAGKLLYKLNSSPLIDASFVANTTNDSIVCPASSGIPCSQAVNIVSSLPQNAKDDNLYLTYKVDGTCERSGTSLAKCVKTYVQKTISSPAKTTDHDDSQTFRLPMYANLTGSSNVVVKIGGIIVPEDATTWQRVQGNYSSTNPASWTHNRIVFNSGYKLYQSQIIEITYFVTDNVSSLFSLKTIAQNEVNQMCQDCGTGKCNLKPEFNEAGSLVNYACVYPTTSSATPPANQTVFVSNKNVPHRYYDKNGVNHDVDFASAPDQEPSGLVEFAYTNADLLKPTNVTAYTGFNEIYGPFAKSGTYLAKPAKMVTVKKNQSYDIFTNSGSFSSCINCGTDYYSSLQKIFPQNLGGQGGGYTPDKYTSTRLNSSSLYRGDDLLFGRACFVPATMIPWTHKTATTVQEQRQMRLAGQHFLFANGYSRDWFGFDYGSMIGSFDGVNWFSIGNQRRIKSTTGRLYLAVNAYYGDVSVDSNFSVTVSETVSGSTTLPDHDTESDGAECQKSHFCSTDNDCFRQLGYDYSCQNISGLTSSSPQFDANAAEVINPVTKILASVVGGTNGQSKRCVYRGRGAPCLTDLTAAGNPGTFNGSSLIGTLSCSANNMCQPLVAGSANFNDRIARFASSPINQNNVSASAGASDPVTDLVGLGARILGRPFDYYGKKAPPISALASLTANNVNGVCIPGKDISGSTTTYQLNSRAPAVRTETSDKIMGVGTTMSTQNLKYMNACPATDAAGTSMQTFNLSMTDTLLSQFAITQNLSSNLLNLTPMTAQNIYSSTGGSKITAVGYQKNTCLRAPGASCFSDFECAPSANIASKAKTADLSSVLNSAEEKYWEEELVCGNADFKTLQPGVQNPNYDIKKNVCCREFGKTMTVFTETDTSDFKWCSGTSVQVAGVNAPISSFNRYSRVHTSYDKMTCDVSQISTTKTFALSVSGATSLDRWKQILGQYKTLDTINQRTCCTQNWVRSFASENGGGHAFSKSKTQTLDKGVFKNISWNGQNTSLGVADEAFGCDADNFANSSCEIRSLTPAEETKYLGWAGSLELIGIPQVAIKTEDQIFQLVDEDQLAQVTALPLAVIKDGDITPTQVQASVAADESNVAFTDTTGKKHFSASSYANFDLTSGGLKKVFSENEFNCCIPTNQEVPVGTTASQCCTGNVANTNGPLRCCLPDFTDVTVYLNRYVSSEGRGLSDSAYDASTGYIKDPAVVKNLVTQKNLCCSGTAMTGVAISRLAIPIEGGGFRPPDQTSTTRRFTYRTDDVDNNSETGSVGSIFDAGVKWNDHVYCVPQGFNE